MLKNMNIQQNLLDKKVSQKSQETKNKKSIYFL